MDTSKLLDLFVFKRLRLCSVVSLEQSFLVGGDSHWLISVAEEVREDKIEIKSVFEQIMPVVSCLLALVDEQGDTDGGGSSEALRLLALLGIGANVVPTKSEYLRPEEFVYLCTPPASSKGCTSHTFSLLVFQSFMRTFLAWTISSIISSWRLWTLPRGSVEGGPVMESLLPGRTLPGAPEGKAATDSLRLLPNKVVGTFEIVTTECRRPPATGAGAVESVARNSACRGEGPDEPSPLSESLRT